MCAGGQRGANDGAEVVGVLDAVEQHNQAFFSAARTGIGGGENVVEVEAKRIPFFRAGKELRVEVNGAADTAQKRSA